MDPGLIPVFDRSGKANLGHAFETTVMLELERRGAEIAYVKTAAGHKVEFLARYPEGRQELIQVCVDAGAPDTREREVRALMAAAQENPRAELHLIVLEAEPMTGLPEHVKVWPASAWLLGEADG